MNEAVRPPQAGEAKFRKLGAASGFEGRESELGRAIGDTLLSLRPDDSSLDFSERAEILGRGVSTVIKTLNHVEVYKHEMNDALVKMTLVHIQFAKKQGLLAEAVAEDIEVTSPMMRRVSALIEKTGNNELALISVFDHTACFFHLVDKVERRPGFVRYRSPFGTVLNNAIRGQFDLTEEEIHEVWTKPRYRGYAEIMNVTLDVSDLDHDGFITVKLI